MCSNHLPLFDVADEFGGFFGGHEVAVDVCFVGEFVHGDGFEGAIASRINSCSQLPGRAAIIRHTAHLSLACTRTQRTYHTNNQPITPHKPRVQKMGQIS